MKRLFLILGLLILAGGLLWGWKTLGRPKAAEPDVVAGELLVQFKPGVTPEQAKRLIGKAGAAVKERIDPQGIYVVALPEGVSVPQMVSQFQRMPEVSFAEPNVIHRLSDLKVRNGAASSSRSHDLDLFLPAEAWADGEPLGAGARVTVAVIDSAMDSRHPALAGKLVQGYNFLNNSSNTQSSGAGSDWHATAVAGRVLEGSGDANVQIMPLVVANSSGSASTAAIVKAINYAVEKGVQVINMSLGSYTYTESLKQAVDLAVSKGILVVAASGNNNTSAPSYPAAYGGVIATASTNEDGLKSSFSNYGKWVNISAPGDMMELLNHGGGTRMGQGTSFSAPFIAGMLAMLKSAFPALTAADAEAVMMAKSNNVDARNPAYAGLLGKGFLNFMDVRNWMAEIRNGTFFLPWQDTGSGSPGSGGGGGAGGVNPPAGPAVPMDWLVKGKGHVGTFVLTPAGDVVQEG